MFFKIMRVRCLFYCALLVALVRDISFGEDDLELFRHETQGGHTNVWLVSFATLDRAPRWNDGEKPPLPLEAAVKISKQWIISQGANTNLWIDSIEIRPVFPGYIKYEGIYYYNVRYGGVGYIGHHRRCIILMSGKIVKPRWLGSNPKSDAPWAYDE
jgi:hypothetical protein